MNIAAWNFGRMRPSNFPTIRIAQFAALICKSQHLLSTLLETEDAEAIRTLFQVEAHEYWNNHFRFDARTRQEHAKDDDSNSVSKTKILGDTSLDNILINTVAVMLFTYGRHHHAQQYVERAMKLLESIAPELNSITENWKTLGVKCTHAADSQSLIQLYNHYCMPKQCLQCSVGLKVLGRN